MCCHRSRRDSSCCHRHPCAIYVVGSFDSEDFESIGGLVLGEISKVPEIDEEVKIENVLFRIVKMHKNRIAQLKVSILDETDDEEEENL